MDESEEQETKRCGFKEEKERQLILELCAKNWNICFFESISKTLIIPSLPAEKAIFGKNG